MPEQDILDMQYELLTHRGQPVDDDLPSKSLLYFYSLYKKDRDAQAQAKAQAASGKRGQFIPAW